MTKEAKQTQLCEIDTHTHAHTHTQTHAPTHRHAHISGGLHGEHNTCSPHCVVLATKQTTCPTVPWQEPISLK